MMNATRIIAVIAIGAFLIMAPKQPRGIRNNNPGNIRADGKTSWQGMTGQDSAGFVVFQSPEYGIRAMRRILQNYRARGLDTIVEIISTWAPDTENDTAAYIQSVGRRTGIDINRRLQDADYPAVIEAIIHHENGKQPYTMAQIAAGVALA